MEVVVEHDRDAIGERAPSGIERVLGAKVGKAHVARAQHRGEAVGQAELRIDIGAVAGPVRPADHVDDELRAVHRDLFDVGLGKAVLGLQVAQGIDRGMGHAADGIALEAEPLDLEAIAQARGERIGVVVAPLVDGEEAVLALDRVDRARDAGLRQPGGAHARFGDQPRLHPLHQAAVLDALLVAARLGIGQAHGAGDAGGIEPEHAAGGGSRAEARDDRRRIPAAKARVAAVAAGRARQPAHDLGAGDDRGGRIGAAGIQRLGDREHRRHDDHARVDRQLAVQIVIFERVRHRRVDQGRGRRRQALAGEPHPARALAPLREQGAQLAHAWRIPGGKRSADGIERQARAGIARARRQVARLQIVGEPGKAGSGVHGIRSSGWRCQMIRPRGVGISSTILKAR